jgi:hypothetical protein
MALNVTSNSETCGTPVTMATNESTHSRCSTALNVDSEIYELQLTQLQEQLITAMIENEQLSKEWQILILLPYLPRVVPRFRKWGGQNYFASEASEKIF